MAGKVWLQVSNRLNTAQVCIEPLPCPLQQGDWPRPTCAIVDRHSPWANLCPFLYGIQAERGGCLLELRSLGEIRDHFATADIVEGRYRALCLRKESAGVEAGARLRC